MKLLCRLLTPCQTPAVASLAVEGYCIRTRFITALPGLGSRMLGASRCGIWTWACENLAFSPMGLDVARSAKNIQRIAA